MKIHFDFDFELYKGNTIDIFTNQYEVIELCGTKNPDCHDTCKMYDYCYISDSYTYKGDLNPKTVIEKLEKIPLVYGKINNDILVLYTEDDMSINQLLE